jgi:drug/metabolite transporter (DMT)-like permease
MILGAMLMWGIDNNVSRRLTLSPGASPAKLAMAKSLFGGLVLIVVAFAMNLQQGLFQIAPALWLIIILMSISGFGGALLLFLEGIKRIGTVKTMSIFSLAAVFGLITAAFVRGESISIFQMTATGIIILGIILVSRG